MTLVSPKRARQIQGLVDGLNPEQRQAALYRGGPVLVLAGAGTGKTRVITVRIAQMVVEGVDPATILALTFTNKAAGEMAERVAEYVGIEAARKMTIGTFHSLGLRMLEREVRLLGYRRGLTLIDASDQASAVRQCLKRLRIDPRRHDPKLFLTTISNARNAGVSVADMAANPKLKLTTRVYQAYLEWLAAYEACDFDDLILRPVELMEAHPGVRRRWKGRFSTILVDEYQDTNTAQLRLMQTLAEDHRSLCVVGDDDQSIYGWRGADFRNILEFERHFSDAHAIALTQNYRSTGHILAAANGVIHHNTERRDKSLWTDVGDGDKVQVVTCKDPSAEATFIAAEIRRRAAAESRPFGDFGVLFRSGLQAQPVEEAFRLAGVPYRVVGAFEFFSRKEVKDALAYLRLLVHPHDDVALHRIINFPQRGIGPVAIAALHEVANHHGGGLWAAINHLDEVARLNAPQRAHLRKFHDDLVAGRAAVRSGKPGATALRELFDTVGAREAWIRDPTEGPGGEKRWRNIERLLDNMRRFEERRGETDLEEYLRIISLDSRSTKDEDDTDKVALMTLHGAKGLEWPVCFLIGCQEGLIPHQRTLEDRHGDVSEERRLFYVGLTRARRTAYVTLSRVRRKFRGTEPARPSRFIREIPPAHKDEQVRAPGGGESTKEDRVARLQAMRDRIRGSS